MGGIIIDGVTALQFKGSFKKFGEALGHLSKQKKYPIETVPLPEFKSTPKFQAVEKRPKGLYWFIKAGS
jgi:hypothetical protein